MTWKNLFAAVLAIAAKFLSAGKTLKWMQYHFCQRIQCDL